MNAKKSTYSLLIATGLIAMVTTTSAEPKLDHSVYAVMLKQYVIQGRVNYAGFKNDESRLDRYLQQLGRIDPNRLDRTGQMAFYINLYNAATIKLILTAYPDIKSIKDLGSLFQSPWKKKFITLNGELISLDHIEHEILRPRFKDPRIHFAINCASKSCPPLLNEPFRAHDLDKQLDAVVANFINDTKSNYIQGDTLYVSRIFKWFNEDFKGDIKGFVYRHAGKDLKTQMDARGSALKIKYLDYDWSLNGK